MRAVLAMADTLRNRSEPRVVQLVVLPAVPAARVSAERSRARSSPSFSRRPGALSGVDVTRRGGHAASQAPEDHQRAGMRPPILASQRPPSHAATSAGLMMSPLPAVLRHKKELAYGRAMHEPLATIITKAMSKNAPPACRH